MAPPLLVAAAGRLLLAAFVALSLAASAANAAVSYDHRSLVINGRRRILISGSIHYPRSTPEVRNPPRTFLLPAPKCHSPVGCCRYRQRSALILAPFVP
jgi:hypothetical protein